MNPIATAAPAAAAAPTVAAVPSWAKHKHFGDHLARRIAAHPKGMHAAADMLRCAERLGVRVRFTEADELEQQVQSAHFCHHRMCPVCSWRKVQAWRHRLIPGLEAFHAAHPNHRPVFLTLTVRNCRLEELRFELQRLHEAWARLRKRRQFPTTYWLARTEITIQKLPGGARMPPNLIPTAVLGRSSPAAPLNYFGRAPQQYGQKHRITEAASPLSQLRDEIAALKERPAPALLQHWVHPHLHLLLMVPTTYWARGYIKQTTWREWWMESARLDYAPVVDVRRGYVRKTEVGSRRESVAAAIEAAKYISKSADVAALGPDVVNLEHQLKHVRMISVSRPLGQFVRPDPIEGAEMTDCDRIDHDDPFTSLWFAQWDAHEQRYQFGA